MDRIEQTNTTVALASRAGSRGWRLFLSSVWVAVLGLPLAAAAIDVPTGAPLSPLGNARAFDQKMLRFEEFGLRPVPSSECTTCTPLPAAGGCDTNPSGSALDDFLSQVVDPLPRRRANTSERNPWESQIETCQQRTFSTSTIEGRPPGENFAHQRWTEFRPEEYFQTATTGARQNLGLRDSYQLHGYNKGEFAPGGLYHLPTTAGIDVRFHPTLPIQDPKALWTFDGTLPPKILMARYGTPILFRHHNALQIDPGANYGFGLHTLTTHEHNGHTPAESDGYTAAFFFPGQFFDYRWPMILAGHDSINTGASTPFAGAPDGTGGIKQIRGDWRETMSTHWFHDHMLDFTAQNVYKGSAAAMNYYSSVDRGHESLNCRHDNPNNPNLCLPSGTALDWGNRDYDVNLLIADKAWDSDGQLFFNIFNLDGFLGDRMTVNWLFKPYLDVRARRYRFRLLNGAVSRYMKIALVNEQNERVPFYLVSNDGNIMEHAVRMTELPTQAIAERYSIIVDFADANPGDKFWFVNVLEHDNGRRPENVIPLQEILSNQYCNGATPENAQRGDCDPAVGKFLELRVHGYGGTDTSMNPADYVEGKNKMIPLPSFTAEELANAKHRRFSFGRSSGTDNSPWTIKTDGGQGLGMDPRRLSAAPDEGTAEIWHIDNGGGGWSHPIHIHFEEGQILSRDGAPPPPWEKWARKDVYRVGRMPDSGDEVVVAIRFREFLGTYMEHCHNTQHEDHAMLLRYDIENPGQTLVIDTPVPTWEGVFYEESFTLPTYKTGDTDLAGGDVPDPPGCVVSEDPEVTCSDGLDNDCDGAVDGDDADCAPVCQITEPSEVSCSDGLDNDCDGAVDADDTDCPLACVITENPETSCADGIDNDCDGDVDGADANCDAPMCLAKREPCSVNSDCCSGKCRGRRNRTCK